MNPTARNIMVGGAIVEAEFRRENEGGGDGIGGEMKETTDNANSAKEEDLKETIMNGTYW